jgi:hypothetical protein
MWVVNDLMLVNFIESGDVVKIDDKIVHVTRIDIQTDIVIIYGYDDNWGEDAVWEYPSDSMIEVMIED